MAVGTLWKVLPLLLLVFLFDVAAPATPSSPSLAPSSQSSLSPVPQHWTENAAHTRTPILRSNNSAFAWQFYPYNNQTTRLLVVLSTLYNKTVVWIANRNHPVSVNATLQSGPDGKLHLQESNGSVVWSTTSAGVKRIDMLDSGNLVMRNAYNVVVWQSFDHPTDTMVTGQTLGTGMSLVSSFSWNSVSEGPYSLKAEPGGAVLYASSHQQKLPYELLNYIIGNNTLAGALHSACNHTIIVYPQDGTEVSLAQQKITPECQQETRGLLSVHSVQFGTRRAGAGFRFLKLDPDGDIRAYFQSASGQVIDNDLFGGFFNSYCKLPAYCGQYGLCSQLKTCTCPSSPAFKAVDPSNPRQGCHHVLPLNCTDATKNDHQLLEFPGVDYYANAYHSQRITSSEECQSSCLSNCSCVAAFFKNTTGVCNHYQEVETLQYNSDATITAFLKVVGSPASRRNHKMLVLEASMGTSALVICLLLVLGWIVRQKFMVEPSEEDAFLESLPGLPPRFSYKELQTATQNFSNSLGTGASGSVHEGVLRDGTVVAVKQLQIAEAQGSKQFRAEVATLGNISHVNLVRLRGFCAEGLHRLLVYEYMSNGSLDRWIFRHDREEQNVLSLPWDTRYRIAVDTARGLAFLHDEARDRVVHLDVKPQNILLDANFSAKLADFGLSKLLDRAQSRTVTAMRGTPGYMAPEWFLNMPITDRSDVFSYGMVLLELIGGRKNLNLAVASEEWYFPAWAVRQVEQGKMMDIIDKELASASIALSEVREQIKCLINVAFWCIQEEASSRPAMSTVLLMLEGHLEVPDPPLDMAYVLKSRNRPKPHVSRGSTTSTSTTSSVPRPGISPLPTA